MAKRVMTHGEYLRIKAVLRRSPKAWPAMRYRGIDSRTCELECPDLDEKELGVLIAELLIAT